MARVDRLTEEEAADRLARIEPEPTSASLTEEELSRLDASERESECGEWVDGEGVFRTLSL